MRVQKKVPKMPGLLGIESNSIYINFSNWELKYSKSPAKMFWGCPPFEKVF